MLRRLINQGNDMRKPYMILTISAVILGVIVTGLFFRWSAASGPRKNLQLVPQDRVMLQQAPGAAATGWSTLDDPRLAVEEAVAHAKARLSNPQPSYAFVLYTINHSPSLIHAALEEQLGPQVKIHGLSSSVGVMTNEGLHIGKVGSVAVLLSSTPTITFT